MTGPELRALRMGIGVSTETVAAVMGITARAVEAAESAADEVSPEFASLFSSALRHLGFGHRTATADFNVEVR